MERTPVSVSYTHLDVYKRQGCGSKPSEGESVDAESAGMVSENSELTKCPSFKGKDLDGNDVNSCLLYTSSLRL